MEKLLNLNEKEKLEKTKYFTLKCRREMINLGAFAPESVRELCVKFKNENFADDFVFKIKNDTEIFQFLEKAEELIQSRIFYTGVNYQEIFNSIFGTDERYLANARELEKASGYYCMKYLYIVINYIDDNFPVISLRELDFSEKKLVEFLLCSGDKEDFIKMHEASWLVVSHLMKGICEIYKCPDINTALNLILIENYLKGSNRMFLKVVDVLK